MRIEHLAMQIIIIHIIERWNEKKGTKKWKGSNDRMDGWKEDGVRSKIK
jgi:hypothetical protein